MDTQQLIVGLIFIVSGAFFLLFRKQVSEGAESLYKKLYTKHNLLYIFSIIGAFLLLAGIIILATG